MLNDELLKKLCSTEINLLNPGDVIHIPDTKDALVKRGVAFIPAKFSRRKTIKIKKFLWFKDISISFNCPSKKMPFYIQQFRRSL